jgi:hypothetical protein
MKQLAIATVVLCMVAAACVAATPASAPPARASAPPAAAPAPAVPVTPAPVAAAPAAPAAPATAPAGTSTLGPATGASATPGDAAAQPGASEPASIDPLLVKLRDPGAPVRAAAATALGEAAHAGNRDPRILTSLIGLIRDGSADVRLAAVAALGATDDRHAVPPLISLLRQPDQKMRAAVARALTRLGPSPDDPANVSTFTNLEKPMPDAGIARRPLKEALQTLAAAAGVQIAPNGPALEKAGLNADVPVTLRTKDTPVVVALWEVLWIARPSHDIGLIVKGGTVIVSTIADLDAQTGPPSQPVAVAQPAQPVQPGQPAQPTQPARPVKPGQPAQPPAADTPPATDQAVRERLNSRIAKLDYDGAGLDEALAHLGGITKLKFQVNWPAMEATGFARSDVVRLHLANVTVAVALQQILDSPFGAKGRFTFLVKDAAVRVSTRADIAAVEKTQPVTAPGATASTATDSK